MNSKILIFSISIVVLVVVLIVVNQNKKLKTDNTYSEEKWNKMIDLWVDFELKGPINDLLTYDAEINNGGHLQFFENKSDNLDNMMVSLKEILPDDVYDNLKSAYDIYLKSNFSIENVDDYVDVASKDSFLEYDTYYYKNDDKINKILKEYAATIKIDDQF